MNEETDRRSGVKTYLSDDIAEARSIGGEVYYPHEIRLLGSDRNFQMRMTAASLGAVTLGRLDYSTEVEIYTNELRDSYQVNIPMRGELITGSGPTRTVATPHRAAVYRCDQRSLLRGWASPYPTPVLALKIDRRALENQLAARLGREIVDPIIFGLEFDLDSVVGRQWLSLVEVLSHQLDSPEALALHPIVAAPMAECLMNGLLVAAEHDYRAELYEPKPALPSIVRLAVDYLEEHAQHPLTVADVAKNVGVSVRSLQVGFRTSLGTTPMRKLKDIRMQKARKELLNADPARASVTEIAQRWGFVHVGRFAGEYKDAFGVSPSEDLRLIPFR